MGALLAIGPRTVAACLRVLGLAEHPGFAAFHRVLNRNAWSGLALARTLLRMVVAAFVPTGPVVIGVDHTLERRRGRRIGPAGHFYDAGRSSAEWQATSRGLRWLTAAVLVEVPFAGHVWALPVLTALTPSKTWSERHGRRHRPVTDWARRLLLALRRWLPDRPIVAVMDGEFAALEPLHSLRLGPARPPGGQGRPAALAGRAHDRSRDALAPRRPGRPRSLAQRRPDRVHLQHGALAPPRQADGPDPLGVGPLPRRAARAGAFLCTDTGAEPREVLDLFDRRWSVETTYEETRAHLGVETQRQWSDPATFRTTPLLLGLYSIVALYVHQHAERLALSPRRAAWYPKPAATFADALARLRHHLWFEHLVASVGESDMTEPIPPELRRLVEVACYAP